MIFVNSIISIVNHLVIFHYYFPFQNAFVNIIAERNVKTKKRLFTADKLYFCFIYRKANLHKVTDKKALPCFEQRRAFQV